MTEKIYEDDKELDVYEARQINKQYNDNWQLASYTSELRTNSDNSVFCFVDFSASGEGRIRECPHCLEYEIHNKLGPKIKKKGEPIAPDDDKFLSCYSCGNTFPIYEAHYESEIKDSLETTDNPFESNESIFLSVGKRKFKNDRLDKYAEDEDPDVAQEQRRVGSENVRIVR